MFFARRQFFAPKQIFCFRLKYRPERRSRYIITLLCQYGLDLYIGLFLSILHHESWNIAISMYVCHLEDPDAQLVSNGLEVVADHSPMCMEMSVIVAVEMSTVPFKTFKFVGRPMLLGRFGMSEPKKIATVKQKVM